MDGSAELRQLAHLMRVGADAARMIASIRNDDVADINRLADQADEIALSIDRIAEGTRLHVTS